MRPKRLGGGGRWHRTLWGDRCMRTAEGDLVVPRSNWAGWKDWFALACYQSDMEWARSLTYRKATERISPLPLWELDDAQEVIDMLRQKIALGGEGVTEAKAALDERRRHWTRVLVGHGEVEHASPKTARVIDSLSKIGIRASLESAAHYVLEDGPASVWPRTEKAAPAPKFNPGLIRHQAR